MSKQFKVPINLVGLSSDPAYGSAGDIYFNTTLNVIKIYANDAWSDLSTFSGAVIVSTTTPPNPVEGQLWYDNDASQVFVYDGSYWVEIALGPQGPAGVGIALGGNINQFLVKSSNNNYETQWITLPAKDLTSTDISHLTGTTDNVQDQIDSLSTNLTNTTALYVPLADIGAADGVVGLNSNSNAIVPGSSIIFEGSAADEYETSLQVINPTADRTISIPDETGTIALTNNKLTDFALPTSSLSLNSQKIINLSDPSNSQDAATKSYVDAATSGLNVHASVKAATTTNITLATAVDNGKVLDGVTLSTGDRILIKNQNTQSENGIYIVSSSGAPSRAIDYDSPGEVDAGDFIFVETGTVNAKTGWIQTNVITTLNVDSILFTQFSGAGTYSAGTGLTLTGSTFSINTATTVDLNTTQTLTNKTISGSSNTFSNIPNSSLSNSSITVNGSAVSLGGSVTIDALPSQTGQSGKYLTTNGTVASWATINLAAVTDNLTMQIMGAY